MPDIADAPKKPINDFIRPIPGMLPELFVPAGGQAEADGRRYEFSRMTIEKGGYISLRFNSREALQFVVEGDVVLNGEIYLWNSASEERETNLTFPDGQAVRFAYRNNNRGGDGGAGQGFNPGPVSAHGGRGARGTTSSGGGGGGGASATFRDGHGGGWINPTNGENATDDRGAFGGAPMGGSGGDGAERDAYKTGGMLYLLVKGDFDGSGGKIFANGNNGCSGGSGTLATQPGYGGTSLGGGGGGGPGGKGALSLFTSRDTLLRGPTPIFAVVREAMGAARMADAVRTARPASPSSEPRTLHPPSPHRSPATKPRRRQEGWRFDRRPISSGKER